MPFQKGYTPWAKGRKFTKDHREKLGKAHLGIVHTEEVLERIRQKLKGRTAWNKGKRCSWRGNKHWNWKGGKHLNRQGYIIISKREHPFCDSHGYIREHRYIIEQKLGRYLNPKERVHHINKIKTDNRVENLRLFSTDSEHKSFEILNTNHNFKNNQFKKGQTPWNKNKISI